MDVCFQYLYLSMYFLPDQYPHRSTKSASYMTRVLFCSCNLHWDHAELGRYAKYYLIASVHTWKTAMQLHALIFCNHILPPTHETSLIENTVRL